MSPSFCVDATPALRATALAALLLVVTSGAACSGGGSATPNDGAAGTSAAGTSGTAGTTGGAGTTGTAGGNAVVGAFAIKLVEVMGTTAAHTTITGVVDDGPQPELVHFVAGTKDGSCTLYTPQVPFCGTACGGSAVCVADDTCQAYPKAKNVGTVKVGGLAGATDYALTYVNGTYQAVGLASTYPPFTEGADVSVSASGGDYSAFSIHTKAIAPLALATSTITLQKDQPLALTWTAAGSGAGSTIHVKLDVSHHGGTKGQLLCDAPDTGSLTISAALVTQLLNLGISGFPSIIVTRSSSGEATIAPGRVQLVVSQDIERYVEIPGLKSCQSNDDCATGQTCQDDLQCK